jgi:hypothetical protein
VCHFWSFGGICLVIHSEEVGSFGGCHCQCKKARETNNWRETPETEKPGQEKKVERQIEILDQTLIISDLPLLL